jgi:hypothetical protein
MACARTLRTNALHRAFARTHLLRPVVSVCVRLLITQACTLNTCTLEHYRLHPKHPCKRTAPCVCADRTATSKTFCFCLRSSSNYISMFIFAAKTWISHRLCPKVPRKRAAPRICAERSVKTFRYRLRSSTKYTIV